jgi:hypothetical protein
MPHRYALNNQVLVIPRDFGRGRMVPIEVLCDFPPEIQVFEVVD